MTSKPHHRRAFLRPLLLAGVVALRALLSFLPQGQRAHAATITVNTTADELNSDGDCSLREAIQAANTDAAVDACAAGSGADTVTVPAGTYTLSISGTGEDANATGDLDITADLTINGAGAVTTIIDGGALDRVFDAGGSTTVEIADVTVRNGNSGSVDGGGILNLGTLTLNSSTVSDNTTSSNGGGIRNIGTLTLNESAVSGNTAGAGGGIHNFSVPLTLNNSTVSGNTATGCCGGGLVNSQGTLTLNNSTVSGNSAGSFGGGVKRWHANP